MIRLLLSLILFLGGLQAQSQTPLCGGCSFQQSTNSSNPATVAMVFFMDPITDYDGECNPYRLFGPWECIPSLTKKCHIKGRVIWTATVNTWVRRMGEPCDSTTYGPGDWQIALDVVLSCGSNLVWLVYTNQDDCVQQKLTSFASLKLECTQCSAPMWPEEW